MKNNPLSWRLLILGSAFMILLSACGSSLDSTPYPTPTRTNTPQSLQTTLTPKPDVTNTSEGFLETETETELSAKDWRSQLQDLLALRTKTLSEKGWLHTVRKFENYWDEFCQQNPDKCATMPENWYRMGPPMHSLEQWIELDGSGHQAGNSLELTLQEDGTPVWAKAATSDHRLSSFYLDPDYQPQEMIQMETNKATTDEGQSVDLLFPDYLSPIQEKVRLNIEKKLEITTSQIDYQGHPALEIMATLPWAAMCQQLDPYPEPTCAMVTIEVIDLENGMLWVSWNGALGASGELHPEKIETLVSFEILPGLPEQAQELWDTLLAKLPE